MSALTSISENASRLGMRIQEQLLEHTRDLPFARSSVATYLDPSDDGLRLVRKQLDSSSDRDKLEAMKRLVALISKGRNVSEYFAQVVKNVASQNLEIRKLVYIFLLRYAEQEPDLSLLSINTFQRDLTDNSPLIRSMALRVLSGINLPSIGSIVMLAIKKCASDMSPYVRKAAALAIPKCYNLDSTHAPMLTEVVSTLLRDTSPLSIGAVALAFDAICPSRLDLLHLHYRRLCQSIVDVDEWGQITLMNLLLRYARTMLPQPHCHREGEVWVEDVDEDLELLLRCVEPLLQSRNSAVVVAAARLILLCNAQSKFARLISPLLRLLHGPSEIRRIAMHYIYELPESLSENLIPFYSHFFIQSRDNRATKLLKIELLLRVNNTEICSVILRELIDYVHDPDNLIVRASATAISRCASLTSECASQSLSALHDMARSHSDVIVSTAVLVLKEVIQTRNQEPTSEDRDGNRSLSIIATLADRLDDIKDPDAKASIIWLVGQHSLPRTGLGNATTAKFAPDILRQCLRTFKAEPAPVKLQVLVLAAKLLSSSSTEKIIVLLAQYAFDLARFDKNYDVRDRSRVLFSLLSGVSESLSAGATPRSSVVLRKEQVQLILFKDDLGRRTQSGALCVDEHAFSPSLMGVKHISLPDWLERGVDSRLRDAGTPSVASPKIKPPVSAETRKQTPASAQVKAPAPWTEDLDEFYAKDQPAEEEQSESGSEETDSEDADDHSNQSIENDSEESESEDSTSDSDESDSSKTDHVTSGTLPETL